MRSHSRALLFLLAFGCSGEGPSPVDEVQTPLSGVAFFTSPSANAAVEVRSVSAPAAEPPIASTMTDDSGAFLVDLGLGSGDLVVEATTVEGTVLSAIVDDVAVEEPRSVVVSPVTTLSAAYVRDLQATGYSLREAHLKARRLFHVHFGRIDQHAVVPVDAIGGRSEVAMLTPQVVSGILLAGLDELFLGIAAGRPAAVLEALSADVEADGLFDGRADDRPLEIELSGQTLRAEYGAAVRRFLEGERNGTAFRPADLADVLAEIEGSQSELFPSGAVDGDTSGPVVSAFSLIDADGEVVDPAGGVRGEVVLSVTFEDPSGVATAVLEEVSGEAAADLAPEADRIVVEIDTARIADGEVPYALVATDDLGNASRMDLLLLFDNTAPVLSVGAPSFSGSPRVTITGTVSDATSGVEAVEVLSFGDVPVALEVTDGGFSGAVSIDCNVALDLEAAARDRAGNEARETVTVYCDDQAPELLLGASPFVQEAGVVIELGENRQLEYSTAEAETLVLSERTAWPVRIEKLLNRLDVDSPNLPTLRFSVSDAGRPGGGSRTTVAYRYLVNGEERRAFASIPARASGAPYEISFSYQTLGPELFMAGPDALHAVEVRVRDGVGNETVRAFPFYMDVLSPPVWLTDCGVAAELSSHTLSVVNFDALYQPGVETDVMSGRLAYLLELSQGSLAPSGPVALLSQAPTVRTRVTELGEEKYQELSTRQFLVGSIEELANYCPFHTPRVFLSSAGVNENTLAADGTYTCEAGRFPVQRTFATGVLNDDPPHAATVALIASTGSEVQPAMGEVSLLPDAPHDLRVRMQGPTLSFSGIPMDWSAASTPAGYVPAQPGSGFRYRTPLSAGLYRTGTDRWDAGISTGILERSFETRTYLQRVEVVTEPVVLSARLPTLPHVSVEVRRTGSCSAPVVREDSL